MALKAISINPITFLPKEVVYKIAFFLTPKNIARLLTVSVEWHNLLSNNELWRWLCPKISIPAEGVFSYLTLYPEMMGIHLVRSARKGGLKCLHVISGLHISNNYYRKITKIRVTESSIISACEPEKTFCICDRSLFQKQILDKYPKEIHIDTIPSSIGRCTKVGTRALGLIINDFATIDNKIVVPVEDSFENSLVMKMLAQSDNGSLESVTGFTGKAKVTCIEATDEHIISGNIGGGLCIWEKSGSMLHHFGIEGGHRMIRCLQLVDNSIFSGGEADIGIWDINGKHLTNLAGPSWETMTCLKVTDTTIAASYGETRINRISGKEDETIELGIIWVWNRATNEVKHILRGHTEMVTGLEIIDNTLISCSHDCTLRIWDLSNGALLKTYDNDIKSFTTMKWQENLLLLGGHKGQIYIWGT
jgi:F-box associated protein/WD40 domain-containing protein